MKETLPAFELRTSSRRTKTASARFEAGLIVVTVPEHLSPERRLKVARELVVKLTSREDVPLVERAKELQAQFLPELKTSFTLRWVDNQTTRWASCSTSSAQIRISSRLKRVPPWVLDAVIVHELAHLVVASHSKEFKKLTDRYPKTRDADLFLEGFALGFSQAPKGEDQAML